MLVMLRTRTGWGLAIALMLATGCQLPVRDEQTTPRAPGFVARSLEGDDLRFAPEALEHPTLFVFWASWCHSCRREVPEITALESRESAQIDVIGVNVDKERASALAMVKSLGMSYPSVADPNLRVTDLFGVEGTPTLIVVDETGRIVYRGTSIDDGFESALRSVR